ncbi:Acetolactate synthase 1 [Hibiscus syriacus]|uniref:Acetolactate synthase 1 n=1 Tax=Hibiscus syriacus TaxID=106335 RepID=A0A6A3AJ81_HIBSY|nr:Acetolactate synthase 1 [Hibiscus syriacus]
MLDSIPVVAITSQVPRRMIRTDVFQDIPIVEVTRTITKHNYLVLDVDDIPRIITEAFFLATSDRPGPVLIDITKDIQQKLAVPKWNQPLRLPGYMSRLPKEPNKAHLEQIVRFISESNRPVLYVGGGCLNSGEELKRFFELTGIRSRSDLLLAFGAWFDDRVTVNLEAFASRANIVHIDIDSAVIGKNKQYHVSELNEQKVKYPLNQHQTWVVQFYKYKRPRQWLTFGGLGAMGFGLPTAIVTTVTNPGTVVVDVDGEGSVTEDGYRIEQNRN